MKVTMGASTTSMPSSSKDEKRGSVQCVYHCTVLPFPDCVNSSVLGLGLGLGLVSLENTMALLHFGSSFITSLYQLVIKLC
jgi:hypothetical protein